MYGINENMPVVSDVSTLQTINIRTHCRHRGLVVYYIKFGLPRSMAGYGAASSKIY